MMVLWRWTWVLEPVCLPYHPLDPEPPWLSRGGSQEPPVPGAGRLHGSLLPVLPSTQHRLSSVTLSLHCRHRQAGAKDIRVGGGPAW